MRNAAIARRRTAPRSQAFRFISKILLLEAPDPEGERPEPEDEEPQELAPERRAIHRRGGGEISRGVRERGDPGQEQRHGPEAGPRHARREEGVDPIAV